MALALQGHFFVRPALSRLESRRRITLTLAAFKPDCDSERDGNRDGCACKDKRELNWHG